MYLDSKQLLRLLSPFIISFLVYFFSVEIMSGARYFFPTYERYSNRDLNEKIDNYIQIETKYMIFKDIQKKIDLRKKEAKWIADSLFYKEFERMFDDVKSEQSKQKSVKTYPYKLQAIFPDYKTAIINGSIVKEGSLIDEARVIKIEATKVAIKTHKGLKWLFLFQ